METIGLILGLLKLSLEIFKDSRKDQYLKKYLEIVKEYNEELSKPPHLVSDYKLDSLLLDSKRLAKLVIAESGKN